VREEEGEQFNRGGEWSGAAPQHLPGHMLAVDSVGELRGLARPIARPASLPHEKREGAGRRGGERFWGPEVVDRTGG